MSRDDSLQTPTQGTKCDLGKPNINPTPITHDKVGPSDTISEPALEDPVMEFVVQNYDRMNAMYKAFTKKLKDGLHQPMCANTEPPVIEPWNSDSDDVHPNYDMPDGIKVLTNLRAYDGTTDPYDHLTVFMGTMDVHKLPEPAWCRFFHITLCGATRFWYDNLAPRIINGFHQLRDKFRWAAPRALVQRLDSKATDIACGFVHTDPQLHTTKDANNENRLQEPRREMKQHMTYRDLPRRQKDKHISRPVGQYMESHRVQHDTFTPLIKSPAEILATSKGRAMLRPLPKIFAPANKRDRTKYWMDGPLGQRTKNEIHMIQAVDANIKKSRFSFPNIAFSKDDPIPEHCTGEDPLIISADVGTTEIHRIYVDGGLMQFRVVASTLHALMKFQTEKGIAVVRGERFQLNICNHISRKRDRPKEANSTEDIEHIIINNAYLDQTLAIAANLPKMLKKQLHELLCSNK
ncbi:hypothetical protein Tco_0601148, partial [Tanacetum coccineum]